MATGSNLAGTRLDFHRGKGGVRRAVSDAIAAIGWDEREMGYVLVRVDRSTGKIESLRATLHEAYRLLEQTIVRYGDSATAQSQQIAEQLPSGKWQIIAECADGRPRIFQAVDEWTRRNRPAMSPELRFTVLSRDGFTCRYCGRPAPDVVLHVDHIKPVVRGGTNDADNLVTACRDCNLGKGARQPLR